MGVPETFIIDQEGIIREIVIGPRDWTRLDSLQVLTKLLNVTPKTAEQSFPVTSEGKRG
jgi:alkyl hydroperoxide reductase subunit AhpC